MGSSQWSPVAIWGVCLVSLFGADWSKGFPTPFLDSWGGGIQNRWWDSLRFHVLRMVRIQFYIDGY